MNFEILFCVADDVFAVKIDVDRHHAEILPERNSF